MSVIILGEESRLLLYCGRDTAFKYHFLVRMRNTAVISQLSFNRGIVWAHENMDGHCKIELNAVLEFLYTQSFTCQGWGFDSHSFLFLIYFYLPCCCVKPHKQWAKLTEWPGWGN